MVRASGTGPSIVLPATYLALVAVAFSSLVYGMAREPSPPGVAVPVAEVTTVPTAAPTTTSTTTSTATTTTAAPRRPKPAFSGSVPDAIRAGFARFGTAVAEQAVRVAYCESTHNPAARNGAHYGLFQISSTWHDARVHRHGFTWERMTEVGPNITVAVDIYAEQGWGPWTCRRVL